MFKTYFLFILFTQNNIFVTLTNSKGDVFFFKSIGFLKTRGLKKLTPSAIKNFIVFYLSKTISKTNIKIHIKLKGFNKCKKLIIKNLVALFSTEILSISDNTNKANNGCKLKKKRRL
nr:ribosomal protein S11 [Neorhodomela munita]